MNKLYCSFALVGGAALLGAPAAQAQLAGAITGLIIGGIAQSKGRPQEPVVVFSKGQYLLTRGGWQEGRIFCDGQKLYLADPKSKDKHPPAVQYPIDSVRSFISMRGDTFCVVRRFTVPKTGEYIRSGFARKAYRAGDIQVNEYTDYSTGLRAANPYVLLCRPDTTVVVPTNLQDERRVLAYMMNDYPALSAQVLQMKEFTSEDLPRVLGIYDRWKAFNARTK